jgi:hypothetical protein
LSPQGLYTIIFITIGDSENVANIFTIYFRDLPIEDTEFKNPNCALQNPDRAILVVGSGRVSQHTPGTHHCFMSFWFDFIGLVEQTLKLPFSCIMIISSRYNIAFRNLKSLTN